MTNPASRYVNRELSWLEFNQRVLDEANDESVPLLERLKFLAITASNLDEFFMIRVGGLQMLAGRGSSSRDPAGMTAAEQLAAIGQRARRMVADQYECFRERLHTTLAEAGIRQVSPPQVTDRQQIVLRRYFDDEVFGVFTPVSIGAADEFPLLMNQTLNLCVQLEPGPRHWEARARRAAGARRASQTRHGSDSEEPVTESRFAIVPFGRIRDRFIALPSDSGYAYMLLEDVVRMHIGALFPGETVVQAIPFRITLNADLAVQEDMAGDLLASMQDLLDERKKSACVRLEIAALANSEVRGFLQRLLHVHDDGVYPVGGPLDLSSFIRLAALPGFDALNYEAWPPRPLPLADRRSRMFDVVRAADTLLSLPYDSFEPVVRFIDEAADDDDVLSIKITLYRTSRDSQIVAALARAAERGKHVTAVVELRARFDEARNIEWAQSLEQSGVQVIYGVQGLKTHAKVCIITRREPVGIRRYVHFSTGNDNESTARLYSDISVLTCNPGLGAEATSFFNSISGYSQPQALRRISLAPIGLRERLIDLIDFEVEQMRQGGGARIMAQLNSLGDPAIIDALYAASQAGVAINLNVRGICCLRPGVPKLSENITAASIIDRYLEHSRILYFYHGGDELVFISSADWMPRNLDRRIELLIPIEDAPSRRRLIEILQSYSSDNVKGRRLLASGDFERPDGVEERRRHRHQAHLYQLACEAEALAQQNERTQFIPHRAAGNGHAANATSNQSRA